jgi:hypothetical protein
MTVTLPSLAPKGNYSLHVYLFNSTGEIDNNVNNPFNNLDKNYDYANDTYEPENYIPMYPMMDPPNKPTLTIQNTNVDAGRRYSYTASTTDPNGDKICYQFQYGNSSGYEYTTFLGYYNSGQSCTDNYMWTNDGSMQVRARARDESGSPNVWSEWSNPLNVNVDPGIRIEGPKVMVLNESYQFYGHAYGFTPENWSWEFSYIDTSFSYNNRTNTTQNAVQEYDGYRNTREQTVNLSVNDSQDNTYTYIVTIDVANISSDFNTSSQGCVQPNVSLDFTDISTVYEEHSIVNWTWNFDDGNMSYDENPSHNYSSDGSYNVTLSVTDNNGSQNTHYRIVHIDSVDSDVIAAPVSSSTEMIISGAEFPIYGSFYDDRSGISIVNISIDYPDGSSKNFTMSSNTSNPYDQELILTSNDTIQVGQLNYTVWTLDRSGNLNKSTDRYFTVLPIMGEVGIGSLNKSVEDNITGTKFKANHYCEVEDITAYVYGSDDNPAEYQCMVYSCSSLEGETETKTVNQTGWVTFNISGSKPVLDKDSYYYLTIWGNNSNAKIFYENHTSEIGMYYEKNYNANPTDLVYGYIESEYRLYSLYCGYTPDTIPPIIGTISATPSTVGNGCDVNITAVATDSVSDVDYLEIWVNSPGDHAEPQNKPDMTKYGATSTYYYIYNNTWKIGQYNYTIYAYDKSGNVNVSSVNSFNVSSYGNVSVCTIYDTYIPTDKDINITDPPSATPIIGHRLLDNDSVLHIWNKYDSYYFNTSSGIQLTNHYDEYWSHNVLMLGYYNNDEWNLIYRTDELSGFNKNIDTDNETYVNVTIWKNLTYNGYDFRLAIRYYLGVDDNELTVIPYIKAYEDIPYVLGFAWELKDIQIDMTEEYDYIEINGTTYYLNTTLDETYADLETPAFYIRENIGDTSSESLYLRWNSSLNYKVQVKSRGGQYNAPVTLAIRIGTMNENQSKHTKLFWHDASEVEYYFDTYSGFEAWATTPGNMVDGSTGTFAYTNTGDDSERCTGNTCNGNDLGTISKVEMRAYGKYNGAGSQNNITLKPVLGSTIGDSYLFVTGTSGDWSQWFDITDDNNIGLEEWSWSNISGLDCKIISEKIKSSFVVYCGKVDLRVTYTANSLPDASNPVPASGSTGVSKTPMLNITITDPDNDTVNVTWYNKIDGVWHAFATNNSVANNTVIRQNYTNATHNGKWYWKVNMTDGTGYQESPVYNFMVGNESKIENTGSTDIKGYLLIQVQYYNTTSEEWVVDEDTINENTTRTISSGNELGLDTIFNGNVGVNDLSFGYGTYRVYAAFRSSAGVVLETSYGNKLEGWYEFEYSNS